MTKKRYSKGTFKKAATDGKSIVIEGFANKAVTDRGNERIPPEAWELANYAKNPIIFYNHDRNVPIGKAIEFKVTDQGLKIKARISRSNEAPIPYIRDLIEEGILSTFSVGFDDHKTARKSDDGETLFDRAELLETSVVTIPMNQESTFQVVSMKSGDSIAYRMKQTKVSTKEDIKTMPYEKMKQEALLQKGAWLAAVIHNAIYEAQKAGKDKGKILESVILEADIDPDMVKDILAGEVTPAPEAFIDAVANVMGIDRDSLMKVNQGDVELEKGPEGEPVEGEEPNEEDDSATEDASELEDDAEDDDENEEMAADEGDKEDDEEEELDEKAQLEKDFQSCVAGKIPKFIDEGMERDEAIAASINFCKEEKGCSIEMSEKHYLDFIAVADGVGVEKAKPCNEDEKAEDTEDEGTEKQADQGDAGGAGITTSVTAKEDPSDLGQPGLDLQKAQLAMAGETINLLKQILEQNQKLADLIADSFGKGSSNGEEVEEDAEVKIDDQVEEEEASEETEEDLVNPEEDEDDLDDEEKTQMVKIRKDLIEIEALNKKLDDLMRYNDCNDDEDDDDY